jgi:ABC-type glycerol-3-phosphate transport system substrate-binding protein
MRPIVLRILSALLVSLLLAACAAPTERIVQTAEQTSRATRTPVSAGTARPQPTSTTAASDVLTLTWWTPEFISPKAPAPAGPLLAKQLADFEAAHEGKVRVNPVLKARYGKGGLLDFLRTTQPVAPGLLPDIVALDVAELEQAVNLGLLQPLDSTLPRTITPTLYAFSRQAGQFDGRTMAIPYVADVEYAVYNRDRMSQPPSTWTGILTEKLPYLFPAASPQSPAAASLSEDAPHAVISQYLSAGGTIDPKTRRLVLQEQPLLRLLNFYRDAREAGLLPKDVLDSSGLDEIWSSYAQGSAAFADVSARRYLANRDALPNTAYAPAPGWSNPVSPIADGWALAITTPDPVRQKVAAELIAWLMAPERAGPWAQAAGWLPTSPAALATWGAAPYHEFLDGQLASAIAPPAGPDNASTATRLQKAVTAVLKGASTPADAVQMALDAK